jgi:hypothetical protein
MTPESRILIEKLLRQEIGNLELDLRFADYSDAEARIEVLLAAARTALAEITGTEPPDDL